MVHIYRLSIIDLDEKKTSKNQHFEQNLKMNL